MGEPDDRRLADSVDGIDHLLDLLGIDVEAAGDDQVLGPADDVQVAARVDARDVAGDEEAVGAELLPGLLRIAPVALEDVGAAHLQDADLAGSKDAACLVGDTDLDVGQARPDRAGDALALERVRGVHAGLGHAVALEDPVAAARLEGLEGLDEQRRRARDEEPHVAAGLAVERGLGQQARIEGRHAHHDRGAWQQADHGLGVEARQEQHLRTAQQNGVARHEEAVGVIDRQGVEQHVVGGKAPEPRQGIGVGAQVAVAEHRAFRPAGGPRGVENPGQVVGLERRAVEVRIEAMAALDQRARAARIQCEERRDAVGARQRANLLGACRVGDHHAWLRVTQKIVDLGRAIGRIERQVGGTDPQAGKVKQQGRGRFFDLCGDAVALRHAERRKQAG